jgi:DNA adenine methylase
MVKSHRASRELVRPFLKWPGGKFRLVKTLRNYLPEVTCLVEPFVGAGALFLNSSYKETIINDINPDLINLYQQLQKNGQQYINEAKKLFIPKYNKAKAYYRMRDQFNRSQHAIERALLFLYLNRHGYNGLCRYNSKGGFNVPFGDYRNPYFPQVEIETFIVRAKHVTLHCQDFTAFLKQFLHSPHLKSTVFYCDPPYAPLSPTANFTSYARLPFSIENQKELAKIAKALAKKGAKVIISNHDTPFTREIYRGASIEQFEVSRTISCKGGTRRKVTELIACY